MAKQNYQLINVKDLAKGIDARSTEDKVKPGYAEDLTNFDTNSAGHLSRRPGYQGYYGWVPLRVTEVRHSGTDITFVLDSSLNLTSLSSTPIVVYGHTSDATAAGDWTTADGGQYYSSFSSTSKYTYSTGSNTTTVLETTHSHDTPDLFVNFVLSDSSTDQDNTYLIPDAVQISKTDPYNVDIDYTNSGSAGNNYIYFADKQAVSGTAFDQTDTIGTTTTTVNITAATHGLNNYQLLTEHYYDNGSEWEQFIPDEVRITKATGAVAVDITNSGASADFKTILSAVPAANVKLKTVPASSTDTIVISTTDSFNFLSVWSYDGTTLTKETPDSVVVDDSADTITITVTNSTASAVDYEVYYEAATLDTSSITVTDNSATSETYTDSNPQLTLWGIQHSSANYDSTAAQEGHVTHIDSYKNTAEERVVAGLGGNLFTARTRAEQAAAYKIPTTNVSIQNRMSTQTLVGPLFGTSAPISFSVTAAEVTDSSGMTWAETSHGLANGDILNFTTDDTLPTGISADTSYYVVSKTDNDFKVSATVGGAAISFTDGGTGTHTVYKQLRSRGAVFDASVSSNTATVTDVAYVTDTTADYTLSFTAKSRTIASCVAAGDKFTVSGMGNSVWDGTFAFDSVQSESATAAVIRLTTANAITAALDESGASGSISCFTDKLTFTANSNLAANDTAVSEPFTTASLTPTVLSVSTTSIFVDGITSNVTLPNAQIVYGKRTSTVVPVEATTNFVAGDMCSFGSFGQEFRVSSISTSNTTITLDESVTFQDGDTPDALAVVGRWIPMEVPTSADDLPDSEVTFHLDSAAYNAQSTLRSTMVSNNMYFSNYADEVLKFDGTNLYQAGFFRWQPQLFLQVNTTTSITLDDRTATQDGVVAATANLFKVTIGEELQFSVGEKIVHGGNGDGAVYTIKALGANASHGLIYTTKAISDTTTNDGTLKPTNRYRYYFRLNAIDANNNRIASAATGADDFVVDLPASGQFRMRLIGMPVFGNYDYDRLELEVYRTTSDASAPFYLVRVADVDFNAGAGYIDVIDSANDEDLADFDTVNVALKGSELGTAWEQPMRAKYVTSAENRLVLGNIKDYPELDITLRRKPGTAAPTAANMAGARWLFRKDSTNTGTATNMTDRVAYEFVNSGAVTITPANISTTVTGAVGTFTSASDVDAGTDVITLNTHGMDTGSRVQLTTTDTLPTGLSLATNYYVIKVDANSFKLASSLDNAIAGTQIDITGTGTGTHTVTPPAAEFSIQSTSHGLSAGDWIYLYHNAAGTDNELNFAGWYQIASAETDGFTIDFSEHGRSNAGGDAADVDRYVAASTTTDVPVWLGTDGNYNQVGGNTIDEFTAMLRLANAINASMRMADTTLASPDQTSFVPWLTANAGSEYGIGQLVIRQPGVFTTTAEVLLPAAITNANVFVGGLLKSASTEHAMSTRLFPSRVIVSYQNFPEIFDNPVAGVVSGDSVVDVNSADGQEITGMVNFFGASTFGGAQGEGIVVVFKSNSIYLLNVNTRQITRLESRGLGCTAPYSIATTQHGIMFANDSGIYRLNRDLSISYVGKFVERIWQDTVNRDQLAVMQGHHWGVGERYKLSVPTGTASTNSNVLVYDHQREGKDQEFGAWTKYDGHAATGWCNLGKDEFWGSTSGDVFVTRRQGDSTDYRDDASAFTATIILKAEDFGLPGQRKVLSYANSHFQLRRTSMSGTSISISNDLDGTFTSAGSFTFTKDASVKTVSASTSPPSRRAEYFQLKYTNSTKDEDVILSGVSYKVAGLPAFGVPQQAETS